MANYRNTPKNLPVWERFNLYVIPEPNSGCWLWDGALDKDGYPGFTDKKKGKIRAHRFSYEYTHSVKLDPKIHVDHTCAVRCCVNPDHLEPVTPAENIKRCKNHVGKRTHCPKGHPYAGDNLVININGKRICRARCNENARRSRMKK